MAAAIQIIGRRSSLFTRVVLFWAESLAVPWTLEPMPDMRATDAASYAGNPALKLPVLRMGASTVFGSQHACRVIAGQAAGSARLVWPEDLHDLTVRNADELAWHAMAMQVQLVMGTVINTSPAETPFFAKVRASLSGSLHWLDSHIDAVRHSLPQQRDLSLLEVALFCLVEHLQFRPTVPVVRHRNLLAFASGYAERDAARLTAYRFDEVPHG